MKLVLGKPIAEQGGTYPGRPGGVAAQDAVLSPGHPSFSTSRLVQGQPHQGAANLTWFATSCPLAVPFVITQPTVVYQLGTINGTSVGNNFDVGIYDEAWNRLVSTGATAASGTGFQAQWVNVTDTGLMPGRYYCVLVRDNVTAARQEGFSFTPGIPLFALAGVMDSATTAYPLPNPLTNMVQVATSTILPNMLIATRALV